LAGITNFVGSIMIILLVFGYATYTHEMAHKNIFRYYGCESEIHYSLTDTKTITNKDCKSTDTIISSQSVVDAVGYNLSPILLILSLIFLQNGLSDGQNTTRD